MNPLPSIKLIPDDQDDIRKLGPLEGDGRGEQPMVKGSSGRAGGRVSPGPASPGRQRSASPLVYPPSGFAPQPSMHQHASHGADHRDREEKEGAESVSRPRLASVRTIMTRGMDGMDEMQLPPLLGGGGEDSSRISSPDPHRGTRAGQGGSHQPFAPALSLAVTPHPPFLERAISAPSAALFPQRPSPTAHRTFPPFAQSSPITSHDHYRPLPALPSAPPTSSTFIRYAADQPGHHQQAYYPDGNRVPTFGEPSGHRGIERGQHGYAGPSVLGTDRYSQAARGGYADHYQVYGRDARYDPGAPRKYYLANPQTGPMPPPLLARHSSSTSRETRESSRTTAAADDVDELDDDNSLPDDSLSPRTGQDGFDPRKRRRKRKRKPAQPGTSRANSDNGPTRPAKFINVAMEKLEFEKGMRWPLPLYLELMKELLRTHLSGLWADIMEDVNQVSVGNELKDVRKVKQTWANEMTRFRSHAEKGRLVTLRTINSSWPWSLQEKEALWRSAVSHCVKKADWNTIAIAVNEVARTLGDGITPKTGADCRKEWQEILSFEYITGRSDGQDDRPTSAVDDGRPPAAGLYPPGTSYAGSPSSSGSQSPSPSPAIPTQRRFTNEEVPHTYRSDDYFSRHAEGRDREGKEETQTDGDDQEVQDLFHRYKRQRLSPTLKTITTIGSEGEGIDHEVGSSRGGRTGGHGGDADRAVNEAVQAHTGESREGGNDRIASVAIRDLMNADVGSGRAEASKADARSPAVVGNRVQEHDETGKIQGQGQGSGRAEQESRDKGGSAGFSAGIGTESGTETGMEVDEQRAEGGGEGQEPAPRPQGSRDVDR